MKNVTHWIAGGPAEGSGRTNDAASRRFPDEAVAGGRAVSRRAPPPPSGVADHLWKCGGGKDL